MRNVDDACFRLELKCLERRGLFFTLQNFNVEKIQDIGSLLLVYQISCWSYAAKS